MNNTFKIILSFIGLVLLQVLVLNKVNLGGYSNPYVFPLFIILLNFEIKNWQKLLLAFILGLVIDMFSGNLGMHTFATVFMTFTIPFILKNFPPKIDKVNYPSMKENGFGWMFLYVSTSLFVHHFIYFIIEAGSLNNFQHTLILTFLSSFISIFISFLLIFTFNNEK